MEEQLTVKIFTENDKRLWNSFVDSSKWGDVLQFWQWGNTKQAEGWQPVRMGIYTNEQPLVLAQALMKKASIIGNYLYVPHGPVFLEKGDLARGLPKLIEALKQYAQEHNCFVLEIEPKIGYLPRQDPSTQEATDQKELSANLAHFIDQEIKEIFLKSGFRLTNRNVQPKYKLYYDLDLSEEQLLGLMKKNTRYNVRLAEKKGVAVKEFAANDPVLGQKLEQFYRLLQETQQRIKGYPIRPLSSFQRLLTEFADSENLSLFEAGLGNEVIAMNISEKTKFWASSFYAASNRLYPEVKAPYLLRWRAVQAAKNYGCKVYDFWGIIPGSEEHKGYSDTKLSFGGTRIDTYGVLSLPINQLKYFIWDKLIPLRSSLAHLFRKF